MKKALLLSGVMAVVFACAGKDAKQADTAVANGPSIYKKYCILCHGANGKLGLNGSKDITASQLTKEERMILIRDGKNTMTPFGGILSEQEIEAVADYTFTLK